MTGLRLTLAHTGPLLGACLLLACGSSHPASEDAGGSPVDGGALDGGAVDGGPGVDSGRVDGGTRGPCEPEEAWREICPATLCDRPSSWHWDGERCVEMDCGTCQGADCGRGTLSRTECEAAHSTCEPPLCRGTGGTWVWWAPVCGQYRCGFPPPEACEVPNAACDCGEGSNFVAGVGCQPDPRCPAGDPLPADALCAATGGTWGAICCDSVCGVPCLATCLDLACDCGPMKVFDLLRGCVVGQRCVERLTGESCEGDARCEDGTICCDSCGGAGCAGMPTCRIPVCSADPAIDTCGNDSMAP